MAVAEAKDVGVTITTATTSGTVTRGARGLVFIFSTDFAGTIAGATFSGTDVPLVVPVKTGDTTSAISYTVTAGNVRIVVVR